MRPCATMCTMCRRGFRLSGKLQKAEDGSQQSQHAAIPSDTSIDSPLSDSTSWTSPDRSLAGTDPLSNGRSIAKLSTTRLGMYEIFLTGR